jgi:hypothetical protein
MVLSMTTDHDTHGRVTADDYPNMSHCPCCGGVRQAECSKAGCGYCAAASAPAPTEADIEALLSGAAQQPRDLAGRIRALVQEYAGRWADDDTTTSDDHAEAMTLLRAAYRGARKGRDASNAIAKLRQYGRAPYQRAADELEAIARGEGAVLELAEQDR